jgi:hypothetical protein
MVEGNRHRQGFPFSARSSRWFSRSQIRQLRRASTSPSVTWRTAPGPLLHIQSFNYEQILRYALATKTARVTVRQPNGTPQFRQGDNGQPDTSPSVRHMGPENISPRASSRNIISYHLVARTEQPVRRVGKRNLRDLLENVKLKLRPHAPSGRRRIKNMVA